MTPSRTRPRSTGHGGQEAHEPIHRAPQYALRNFADCSVIFLICSLGMAMEELRFTGLYFLADFALMTSEKSGTTRSVEEGVRDPPCDRL